MKTVTMYDVEELARLIRKYAKTGDTDILAAEKEVAESMSKRAFNSDLMRFSFKELFDSICGIYPLAGKNASNDLLVQVLELIGIHVVDERGK